MSAEVKLDKKTIQSSCRICLSEQNNLQSINSLSFDGLKYSDLITSIVPSISISDDDLLSKKICEICCANAQSSYLFQQLCINSHTNVLEKINSGEVLIKESLKLEVLDEEDGIPENDIIEEEVPEELSDSESDYSMAEEGGVVKEDSDSDFELNPSKEKRNTRKSQSESNKRIVECGTCHRKFSSELTRKRHEILHTDIVTQIKEDNSEKVCIVCGSEVAKNMENHLKIHKTEIEKTKIGNCRLCSKTFEKFNHLVRHIKTHFKTHQCTVCSKEFSMGPELIDHLNRHKGRNFPEKFSPDLLE